MPLQPNRSGIFLFIRLQPYPAAPRQLLAPLLPSDRFQKPTTWGNVPAAEPALNTGPPAPSPASCSPSWPPDHSIDRAVDACDGIQHPDFPLLLKNAGRNLSRLCPHVRMLIPHSGAHLSRQSHLCVCSFLPRPLLRIRCIQGIIKFLHTQNFPKKCRNFQFDHTCAEFCYRMTFHRL